MSDKPRWKELVLELDRLREEKKRANREFNEDIEKINQALIMLALKDDSQQELPLGEDKNEPEG